MPDDDGEDDQDDEFKKAIAASLEFSGSQNPTFNAPQQSVEDYDSDMDDSDLQAAILLSKVCEVSYLFHYTFFDYFSKDNSVYF